MTASPSRYSRREPSAELYPCPACGESFRKTAHNQRYCCQRCYNYARQFDHADVMPHRTVSEWERADKRPPPIRDPKKSLEIRRAAHNARMAAQEALERELSNWPTVDRSLASRLKTVQNWQCNYDLG